MTSTTRTHGPAGALPSPAGRAVRSPQPERGAAAAGADRHPGLASAALRPGVPAAVRGGGPALRSAAVAGKIAMLELIARVPLPGVGERDLRHAHPPASARRAGPAGVRPAGGEPLAAGQRAVAPAHPQRPGYARRGETPGAAPPGDPVADRHGLLPPGLAAVRGQAGLELPAQRPLRRPRPNTSTCSTSPNTELEHQPDPGAFAADYGRYAGLADLLRQIGHDERTHKQKASCRPPPPTRRALRTRLKRPYCADSGSRHRLPRGAMGALNDERCLL